MKNSVQVLGFVMKGLNHFYNNNNYEDNTNYSHVCNSHFHEI